MIDLPETKRIHELNRFALQIYGVHPKFVRGDK